MHDSSLTISSETDVKIFVEHHKPVSKPLYKPAETEITLDVRADDL